MRAVIRTKRTLKWYLTNWEGSTDQGKSWLQHLRNEGGEKKGSPARIKGTTFTKAGRCGRNTLLKEMQIKWLSSVREDKA